MVRPARWRRFSSAKSGLWRQPPSTIIKNRESWLRGERRDEWHNRVRLPTGGRVTKHDETNSSAGSRGGPLLGLAPFFFLGGSKGRRGKCTPEGSRRGGYPRSNSRPARKDPPRTQG